MEFLLSIETSTKNCSVALFNNNKLISFKEKFSERYSHAENTISFIKETLSIAEIDFSDLDAIVLSKGPGSYTGIRIGTSIAKGLSYSLNIPLISVSTLKAMAYAVAKRYNYNLFCPMIDARRMEVFSALYDKENNNIREVQADVVSATTYDDFLKEKVVFFGDGALKCKEIINNSNAVFIDDILPSAKDMGEIANNKYLLQDFEDVAYFEPFYLKEFVGIIRGN